MADNNYEHEHSHEHVHTHGDGTTHTHTHADGTTHTHTHADGTTHTHTHADGTTHSHSHGLVSSPEEAVAMLRYMLSHNQHHAAELHELAHSFEDEIADLVHDAVDRLSESNDLMEQALALIDNAE